MKFITQIDPLQGLRFVLAAIPGVAVYYAIYYTLFRLGLSPTVAVMVSTIIKRVGVFFIQKFWTFRNDSLKAALWQAPAYFFVYTLVAVLNGACVWILIEKIGISKITAPLYPILPMGVLSFLITRRIFQSKSNV